jgi:pimeloyl-ACP methyl ester carboxylesterase
MASSLPYDEEGFGILTDDDLYLDAILIKPVQAKDSDIKVLRVWVPKFPLTKSSVLTCARQEVKSYGPEGKIANLVFDLRGSGDSDGMAGDVNYNLDLTAVKDWAEERFGAEVNFGFFGFPQSKAGRVYVWPLRSGTVMESYYYPPTGTDLAPPTILYLSSYGNFSRKDDALCTALAEAGYSVYGMDPFRYLLHASANNPLTPEELEADIMMLTQMLPNEPIVIGQPMGAGLALLWAARSRSIRGVIAIGRATAGFSPSHVFQNRNPHTYFLPRMVGNIAPRPAALIQVKGPMGGDPQRVQALFASMKEPRRLEKDREMTPELLLELVQWVIESGQRSSP